MKKFLYVLAFLTLFFTPSAHAQSWSGVLSSARAIDWTSAGLPLTFPDGESTSNAWTPPVRTQCGVTVSGGSSVSTINSAMAACPTGHYVLLGPGTFNINSATVTLYAQNGITLRGSGPQATTVIFTGSTEVDFSNAGFGAPFCPTWATGFSQGATSLTVTGCTSTPVMGQLLQLQQCDSGFSGVSTNPLTVGTGCGVGASFDNGGLYACGLVVPCQRAGEGTGTPYNQKQIVYVTSVSGSAGNFTIGFTPGLYMPNWGVTINSQYSTPLVSWLVGAHVVAPYGDGLEDLTIYEQSDTPSSGHVVALTNCYACWVKGVRIISNDTSGFPIPIFVNGSKNYLVANNYLFNVLSLSGQFGPGIQTSSVSDGLLLNNKTTGSVGWEGEGALSGDVIAYNDVNDTFTMDTNGWFEHGPIDPFMLVEGNNVDSDQDDDTHGTHFLATRFRERIRGCDNPYAVIPHHSGFDLGNYARFENLIGNVIGDSACSLSIYQTSTNGVYNYSFGISTGEPSHFDPLTGATAMRWGNWDSVTNAVRWCGNSSNPGWATTCSSTSEVPTSLSGAAVPFQNSVPASFTLPASFFLSTTAHPSGGTGLSWWKVCTAWSSFPSTCSSTSTPPFPPIGPDVTGGPYDSGFANDIPAGLAWINLPVDSTYQTSHAITGSSWAGGVETLNVTGLPASTEHLMGAFQLSGVNSACTAGATFNASNEILMTGSSTTQITYALSGNPGVSCTGTFKFPDVRQFDESVFMMDSSPTPPSNPASIPWMFSLNMSPRFPKFTEVSNVH